MQEGKLGKGLNKVIVEKGNNKEELVVVDPKLGASPFTLSHSPPCQLIPLSCSSPNQKKKGIEVISDIDTLDLFRGIRSQLGALWNGLDPKDLATMSLGLSHSES